MPKSLAIKIALLFLTIIAISLLSSPTVVVFALAFLIWIIGPIIALLVGEGFRQIGIILTQDQLFSGLTVVAFAMAFLYLVAAVRQLAKGNKWVAALHAYGAAFCIALPGIHWLLPDMLNGWPL